MHQQDPVLSATYKPNIHRIFNVDEYWARNEFNVGVYAIS
jgi:hypothetical protein